MTKNIIFNKPSKSFSLNNTLLNISKITIIVFVGFYLLTNFIPFFETVDGRSLANVAIHFSHGEFTYSNELLSQTGREEFVLGDWGLSPNNSEVFPRGDLGFRLLASLFYTVFGNFGLFYLGPILGISSLIIADRFATKFFGKYTGLLTILFLATNHLIYRSFLNLQTESLFLIFFLLGCYALFSFYKTQNNLSILLSSIFFMLSTFTRINGIIYFPIEIPMVIFILFLFNNKSGKSTISKFNFSKIFSNQKNLKVIFYAVIPWLIFLTFWFMFHDHFYGDPLENRRTDGPHGSTSNISSLVSIESKNFENMKQFSKYLLPYQFPAIYNNSEPSLKNVLGNEWLGTISLIFLFSMVLISFIFKIKRLEIFTLFLFILFTIWFYSSLTTESRAEFGVPGRYIMPAFTLFFIILSFYIVKLFNWKQNSSRTIPFCNIVKITIFTILLLFFSTSFYFIPPVQSIINENFEIKNSIQLNEVFPPSTEGISTNDVILSDSTNVALLYGAIPFNIEPNENRLLEPKSIELLRTILQFDYNVFIFKQETVVGEKITLKNLVDEHGFVLKNYSESFCKIKIFDKDQSFEEISDSECLENKISKSYSLLPS